MTAKEAILFMARAHDRNVESRSWYPSDSGRESKAIFFGDESVEPFSFFDATGPFFFAGTALLLFRRVCVAVRLAAISLRNDSCCRDSDVA